jgi:hypothetical protein
MGRGTAIVLLLLAACASRDPSPEGQTRAPIVNGTIDTGDVEVVALTDRGVDFCTGTLVSPRVVVTAGHCVEGAPFTSIDVFFGSNVASGTGTFIHVIDGATAPGWDYDTLANDIAILLLESPAPVPPKPIATEAMGSWAVGQRTRLVGFGVTSGNGQTSGVKRQAETSITQVNDTDFKYDTSPGQTCFGDSGGPAYVTYDDGIERLVGVTSWGDQDCTVYGWDTNVGHYWTSFIQPFIAANDTAGTCADDGVCIACETPDPDCADGCGANGSCQTGCASPDPDCDETCSAGDGCQSGCTPRDPDCPSPTTGYGERCDTSDECASGSCVTSPDDLTVKFCSHSCETSADCDAGQDGAAMICGDVVGGGMSCIYDGPSPGGQGWACTVDSDCAGQICEGPDGASYCTRSCEAATDTCPAGFTCQVTEGEERVCLVAADGGCTAAPGGRSPVAGLAAFLLLLVPVLLRRRGTARRP